MNLETPIWMIILSNISSKEGKNIKKIITHASQNYSHGFNLIKEMEKRGWITIKKEGRENKVHLTKIGRALANNCIEVLFNMK